MGEFELRVVDVDPFSWSIRWDRVACNSWISSKGSCHRGDTGIVEQVEHVIGNRRINVDECGISRNLRQAIATTGGCTHGLSVTQMWSNSRLG